MGNNSLLNENVLLVIFRLSSIKYDAFTFSVFIFFLLGHWKWIDGGERTLYRAELWFIITNIFSPFSVQLN